MPTAVTTCLRRTFCVGAAALLAACASAPSGPTLESANFLSERSASAMGANRLTTLRYTAEGVGYTFGQAYKPYDPWPKVTLHSVKRSIDYAGASMREEVVLSRAEPLGGGGYPPVAQQRNDQFIAGETAWNVAGVNAVAGPRFVTDRVHQLWITPHGALKAAMRNGATVRAGVGGVNGLVFTQPGRFSATVWIGADGLVTQVDSTVADPVLGDTPTVTTYNDYRDFGGIKFPMLIRQSMGGFPVLDIAVKTVEPNAPVAIAVPEAARDQGERVTADKVADGVWFIGGGSHNSVLVERADHVVLIEAPLNDARTGAVIERAKQLVPNKPIRYVVNSHHHFDHSGGVRAAVAEGAIVVAESANVAYFEKVFLQPNLIRPDRLAQSGKRPTFARAGETFLLDDPVQPIRVHRIDGNAHAAPFLLVYLPKDKLLIEADAFTPGPPGAPPPTVPNASTVNLLANVERLGLVVDRVLPLHGRVVPGADLYVAAGKIPPAR